MDQTAENVRAESRRQLINVIIMSTAFMLIFTAFQTCANIQETVLSNTVGEHAGYTSLCIIYIVFAATNWFAPSVISITGQKYGMFIGGIVYSAFIATFLYPNEYLLYIFSSLIGIGAAVIWTAQGSYLTINSSGETMGRNSGLFWAIFQSSLLVGNLFVYFEFRGETEIEAGTRRLVFTVLLAVSGAGTLAMLVLQDRRQMALDPTGANVQTTHARETNVAKTITALRRSMALMKTREMQLLSLTFLYTGLELTFFSGVYSTTIGQTMRVENSKALVGLSGVFVGVGEILGGGSFGILGARTKKYGRDVIVLLGLIVHLAAFAGVFLFFPSNAPIQETYDFSYLTPSQYVALTGSFLLGFGDSCFNTQVYSLLGFLFPEDSSPAFAIFKFFQSFAAAVGFFYSGSLILEWQLIILVVSSLFGSFAFFLVEWRARVASRSGYAEID